LPLPLLARADEVIEQGFCCICSRQLLALSVYARMSVLALLLEDERTMRQHKNGGGDPSNSRSAVLQ
jgi:hypothetical protein